MTTALHKPLIEKNTAYKPVWIMRQAGRYLPEYLKVRATAGSFMNLCRTPALAAEVTLQPLRRFEMDAAIIFSDILMVPFALGQHVTFVEGEGPKLSRIDHPNDLVFLKTNNAATALQPTYEALSLVRSALPAQKSLIGFAGAPWTVATYMLEGSSSRTFSKALDFMREYPSGMDVLIDIIVETTTEHLIAQAQAGADVLQIFDSWAGVLEGEDFTRRVISPTQKIIAGVKSATNNIPIIGFPRKTRGHNLTRYCLETGVDGVGIDEDLSAFEACTLIPPHICIQGNISPKSLVMGGDTLKQAVTQCLEGFKDRAHIVNLGHGIVPETPPEHVTEMLELIKAF